MNLTQIKCLSVFAIFAIIGFGPISPGCLIGLYVVLFRPQWFWTVTVHLYANKPLSQTTIQAATTIQTKQTRKKCFLSILGLFIIDIAPVPVTPVVAFAIILSRPLWFYRLVAKVYGKG
ncbi:MAG: hypothetical protein Q8Q54_00130 [Methylococcales bacterium]|nr:hypothetical protein [Methylococcales bacterium]MDP3008290.1 hypothetical protein [Methylococcales bacterium]MDP3837311.1 hypothetical protein [Methylococcales bacterium]